MVWRGPREQLFNVLRRKEKDQKIHEKKKILFGVGTLGLGSDKVSANVGHICYTVLLLIRPLRKKFAASLTPLKKKPSKLTRVVC